MPELGGMVRGAMTTDGGSSESEFDSLTKTNNKLMIQQRLIDITWRTLQNHRSSTRDAFPSPNSASSSPSTHTCPCSNPAASNLDSIAGGTIEEDIVLLENKLMKYFSRQLRVKHSYLKQAQFSDDEEGFSLEDAGKTLDEHLDLEVFLNIVDLEPRSINAICEELTLDNLFMMPWASVEMILLKHCIRPDERKKLQLYLECLNHYYEKWENSEKPTAPSYERLNSTSSRLSSQGSFDHELKSDTSGQLTSPPFPLAQSSSTPTPLTPSSSQSLLTSPPSTASTPTTSAQMQVVQQAIVMTHSFSSAAIGVSATYSPTLNRNFSTSSSVLLGGTESNGSQLKRQSQAVRPPPQRYKNRKRGHCRSHSNPLANIVLVPEPDPQPVPQYSSVYSVNSGGTTSESGSLYGSYGNNWYNSTSGRHGKRSPSPPMSATPPSRSGSQPSMVCHSATGSPSAVTKNKSHPQMRRILVSSSDYSSGPSVPQTAPILSPSSHPHEQQYFRQSTYPDPPPRCNSLASAETSRLQKSSHLGRGDLTSTSMVDLPATMAVSTDHLDRISECSLPQKKSQSVPKLTFVTISTDNDKYVDAGGSTSVPTSPRTPGNYTPTGHIGHAICHRFSSKTIMTRHMCDYCKKTLLIGVKCKECKYICHKACSLKAPPSCGLPKELMEYFRKQVILSNSSPSPSVENFVSPSEPYSARPRLEKYHTYDSDTREDMREVFTTGREQIVIQELSKEPVKGQFSPVMEAKKKRHSHENGRIRQIYSTSTLEVPHSHHHHGNFQSASTTPSTTPPTSPSLSPSSPRSPNENYSPGYTYPSTPLVTYTDDEDSVSEEMPMLTNVSILEEDDSYRSQSSSPCYLKDTISDFERVNSDSPRGLRPPPQVVPAQSLPNLLIANGPNGQKSTDSNSSSDSYSSADLHYYRSSIHQRTLSTSDSKTSTLVNSQPTEPEEDLYEDVDGDEDYHPTVRVRHRNSVVDEWNIPYSDIKLGELIGRGPVGEVFRGYWHGEVAIKRFHLHATPEQLSRFKAEVSVLKRTRHDNLALFMGASLTSPNLAIVTSFCKGHTLYKYAHIWSEPFSVDKSLNIAKQVATALGYLHARGIVHKDLNTKNIFLDKDKVVITDTGLSSLSDFISAQVPSTAIARRCAIVPRTKLYYLAPEIMKVLSAFPEEQENGDLYPYSEKTDVYAFGTVLYELLTRKFPFVTDSLGLPLDPTTVIFLVGSGERQEIQSREVPKRIKDLVWDCWKSDPKKRFPISAIWDILMKLSRKKTPIVRSPSFPISLSRSTDNLTIQ